MCCITTQSNLYPTVGLQTPGEVVDANFGQSPFVFNIEDMMKVRYISISPATTSCAPMAIFKRVYTYSLAPEGIYGIWRVEPRC